MENNFMFLFKKYFYAIFHMISFNHIVIGIGEPVTQGPYHQ